MTEDLWTRLVLVLDEFERIEDEPALIASWWASDARQVLVEIEEAVKSGEIPVSEEVPA